MVTGSAAIRQSWQKYGRFGGCGALPNHHGSTHRRSPELDTIARTREISSRNPV
jgi:hypothetical protein